MSATRTFAVSLTIPDNEAFTAYETLGRLGIPVARVARSDIWQFEVDESAGDLAATIASIESIHNPNKHRLAERESDRPAPGEIWIAARDEAPGDASSPGARSPGCAPSAVAPRGVCSTTPAATSPRPSSTRRSKRSSVTPRSRWLYENAHIGTEAKLT